MRSRALSSGQLGWAVGAGVAICLVWILVLSQLSRPFALGSRLEQMNATLARVASAQAKPGDLERYPPGAACEGNGEREAASLRSRLMAVARPLKLAALDLEVDQAATTLESDRRVIASHRVSIAANGDYSALIAVLRELALARPIVVVDRSDLVSHGGYWRMTLGGRFYCVPRSTRSS